MALWLCGCSLPPINQPLPQPVTPTQHKLEITVGGTGQVNVGVGGGADINVKNASQPSSPAVERCDCGCNQGPDCRCSSRSAEKRVSAVDTTAGRGPQIVPTKRVYECRNGVCGWYDAPSVASPRVASSGRLTVYYQPGNPASEAMRRDLGDSVDWIAGGAPPIINGNRWWPTAVKPNGAAWSPAQAGWSESSHQMFKDWAAQ